MVCIDTAQSSLLKGEHTGLPRHTFRHTFLAVQGGLCAFVALWTSDKLHPMTFNAIGPTLRNIHHVKAI